MSGRCVKLGNVDLSGQQIMNLWKMRPRISKREGIPIDSRDDTEIVLGSIIDREIDRMILMKVSCKTKSMMNKHSQ
jgi:hypothetical protein